MSVFFGGAKPPPNSCRFRGRFGPGSDFAGDFGAYFGAPLSVGEGGEPGPDCPPYRRYRGEGGRNEHRKYPLISPPWGGAPTVPEVHLSTEKAAIPFPTFPIVGDVPVHPPSRTPLRPRRSGSPAPATSVCESRGWPTGSRRGRRRPPSSPPSSAPRSPWSPRGSGRGRSS